MSFKTLGSKSMTVGGGHAVWKVMYEKLTSGGYLDLTLSAGEFFPAGTPVSIASAGGAAYPVYFLKVAAAAAQNATAVVIEAGADYIVPAVGDKVTVLNGAELTISDVGDVSNDTIELTVAALSAAIAEGATLIVTKHRGKTISLANLKGLTGEDIYVEGDGFTATCDVVTRGTIYADRLPLYFPDDVKGKLPNINFEGGI